jgi:16S rRNA (guanine(966)-N(2))-methyltransferase RsmD
MLVSPKSSRIRPTADRVRESIFNILGQSMDGLAVLDLYAGTGALSFEALSRGAKSAVLVDSSRAAVRLCLSNAEALGFDPQVRMLAMPVKRALSQLRSEKQVFDLIFADPPYGREMATGVLEELSESGLLAPGGTLCIEHDKREVLPAPVERLTRVDARRFGDTAISFFRTSLTTP